MYDIDSISRDVAAILSDYDSIIYVSSESIKEATHLLRTGRIVPQRGIKIPSVLTFVEDICGFEVKYVTRQHLDTFDKLPFVGKHNDPSDRLIIAQAISEKIPLISTDTLFPAYCSVLPTFDLIFNDKSEGHGHLKKSRR